MMKSVALIVLLSVVWTISPAKMTDSTAIQEPLSHLNSRIQTPTKNALVRAVPKNKRQFLVPALLDLEDSDDPQGVDVLDLYIGYRRPEIIRSQPFDDVDDDLITDYVIIRLAVARARAMAAYRQKYCNSV